MATQGAAFLVAGMALVTALEPLLPDWNVTYSPPRDEGDLKGDNGQYAALWVVPQGAGKFELDSFPDGWRDDCELTLRFWHVDPYDTTQEEVDEVVSLAMGELFELVVADPRMAGAYTPPGWEITHALLDSYEWDGGALNERPGFFQVADVTLSVTATRC